jgi:hypothetical protein
MRALVLLILVSVVFQSGCTKTVYLHPESSQQRWARDSYECERDAGQASELTRSSEMLDAYDRCLASRGWTKTQELDLPVRKRN